MTGDSRVVGEKTGRVDGPQSVSDIDVLAMRRREPHDVIVADCKSWAGGLWGDWLLDDNSKSGVRERQYFKAPFQPEWQAGLIAKVQEELGTDEFVYRIFCTRVRAAKLLRASEG